MSAKRIIPCLDITGGRVVKGVRFVELRDAGDPVAVARAYEAQGADELAFLDITASSEGRRTMSYGARRRPVCSCPDVGRHSHHPRHPASAPSRGRQGVAQHRRHSQPWLLNEAARQFGSQCIVLPLTPGAIPGPG